MTKYDKIYVPVLNPDTKLTVCSWNNSERVFVGEENVLTESNVIVLTVEELRQIWEYAEMRGRDPIDCYDFETVLKDKGINIEG